MASFNPQDEMAGAPRKKSSGTKTLLIILGVLGALGLICCGSFGGLVWFGASKFNELVTEDLRRRLAESPTATTELGTIETLNLNILRSTQYTQEKNPSGKQEKAFLVFDVKAANASGEIVCEVRNRGNGNGGGQSDDIISCKLVKSDGTEVELFGDEMSIDLGAEMEAGAPAEPATP
jgi:hypothetical protein